MSSIGYQCLPYRQISAVKYYNYCIFLWVDFMKRCQFAQRAVAVKNMTSQEIKLILVLAMTKKKLDISVVWDYWKPYYKRFHPIH